MGAYLRQLTLVKQYLWGSLAIAIIPLVVIAALYDSHNSSLTNRILSEKIEGELQATVVKIENFIDIQIKRLDDLADLQGVDTIFADNPNQAPSEQLLDFLYFETSDPDIYSIEFYSSNGKFLWSLPDSTDHPSYLKWLDTEVYSTSISSPMLPSSGKPGWFHVYKPVVRHSEAIGIIALRVRLTSLTEKTASLHRYGIHEPIIFTPKKIALNAVGGIVNPDSLLATSEPFLPGWSVGLKQSGEPVVETGIRRWLLFFVMLSAVSVVGLFFSMSQRLARWVIPLKNGAKEIANGNLGVKVSENSPGELGMLARSFNNMSEQLTSMIASRVDVERRAALGSLATGIAHEIRNPLATIGTTVHGLMGSESDPERKKMLEAVDNEIIRTDAIVEEFMNYARPREPKIESISVRDVFNHVKVLVSATALEASVEISLSGQRSVMVFADSGQLRQVLMNIIFNAIQAMPDGGHLGLKAIDNGQFSDITVSDTGVGITPEALTKVQQPFFTTKRGGTGLGLAICSQLIKVNGGTFEIESRVGVGTTIRITLPKAQKNTTEGKGI